MKNQIINEIISIEGGYTNNPDDSGGETNYGITIAVARKFGYQGKMIDLPLLTAFNIYSKIYWDSVRGDDLQILSKLVTKEVVDTGINMGVNRASIFLQRSLNVLNNKGELYPDIVVDGNIGNATINALSSYLLHRDDEVLSKMLNCLQGAFYVDLSEKREKDESFIYGWFKNRVTL